MQPIKIFCSWAYNSSKDKGYVIDLEKHLVASLGNRVVIWHAYKTSPGADLEHEILVHLRSADIVLLLVSLDYMGSDHCLNIEAKQALQMESTSKVSVRVVPLSPVDWENAPFSGCQVLPKKGKFVSKWTHRDEAFLDIVQGIKEVVQEIRKNRSEQETKPVQFGPTPNESHVITAMPPPEAIMRNRQTEEPKLIIQTEELKRNKRTEELQPRKQPARARNSRQLLADESSSSEFAHVPKKKALPGIKSSSSGKSVVRNSNKLRPADRTHWSKRISYEYRYASKGNYGIFLFSMLVFDVVGMPATIWGWSNSAGLFGSRSSYH